MPKNYCPRGRLKKNEGKKVPRGLSFSCSIKKKKTFERERKFQRGEIKFQRGEA